MSINSAAFQLHMVQHVLHETRLSTRMMTMRAQIVYVLTWTSCLGCQKSKLEWVNSHLEPGFQPFLCTMTEERSFTQKLIDTGLSAVGCPGTPCTWRKLGMMFRRLRRGVCIWKNDVNDMKPIKEQVVPFCRERPDFLGVYAWSIGSFWTACKGGCDTEESLEKLSTGEAICMGDGGVSSECYNSRRERRGRFECDQMATLSVKASTSVTWWFELRRRYYVWWVTTSKKLLVRCDSPKNNRSGVQRDSKMDSSNLCSCSLAAKSAKNPSIIRKDSSH